jgi:hypothetical protein
VVVVVVVGAQRGCGVVVVGAKWVWWWVQSRWVHSLGVVVGAIAGVVVGKQRCCGCGCGR